MRRTEDRLILTALAIAGRSSGSPHRAALLVSAHHPIDGLGRQRRKPRRLGLVTGEPCDPFVHEALLPAPDHRLVLADRPGDGVSVDAISKAIRARQTCFRGLLRSRTIASSRSRAAGVTVIVFPCISGTLAQTRFPRNTLRESSVKCYPLSCLPFPVAGV
jgi:hypothetical protein